MSSKVFNAVKRNRKRGYIPKPPPEEYKSPLITHFHKWDGCEKRLSKDSIPTNISFNLKSNTYARKLTSDLRNQSGSKGLTVPKDLLVRFSLLQKPEDGSLWLLPFLSPHKTGVGSGYAPNNKNLMINKIASFSPREVMTNLSTMTTIKDLQWSKRTDLLLNKMYIDLLIEKMSLVKFNSVEEKIGDLVIYFNKGERFEVQDGITYVNLSKYQFDCENYKDFKTKLTEINDEKIIVKSHFGPFIDLFIKFIFYNK